MSRKLMEKARQRLSAETGSRSKPWGGRFSVALVYPNTYYHGMSNLGFQTVYHLINSCEDALCERFFLPDQGDLDEYRKSGTPLLSLESGRPLADFDLIAFSISFENDYLNLPGLFDLARIPLWAEEREDRFPPVLCGGVCAFLNPEPLVGIMDLFAIGEAEVLLPALLQRLKSAAGTRSQLLETLAQIPGLYVPSLYGVAYHRDGTVECYRPTEGAPERVRRQWLADLNESETRSFVQAQETEFAEMHLLEISRGCSRGCRFCAAGYLFLPPRERSLENLFAQSKEGLCSRNRVGLVSPAVSDYSRLPELSAHILEQGGSVSVSSLRLDALSDAEVGALAKAGHRTVAIAPEAGSQRLRDVINKGIDEAQILEAVRLLGEAGILNLKLYFLIGLPTETEEDIQAILDLSEKVGKIWLETGRARGRLGVVSLSVNPFVPKPFTPFQWAAMETEKSLKRKIRTLRSAVARRPNQEFSAESVRSSLLQGFLARGDRGAGRVLPHLAAGDNLPGACRREGIDPAFYLHRERSEDERFPWEVLDSGVARDYLRKEYRRALSAQNTPRCSVDCHRCGVCR